MTLVIIERGRKEMRLYDLSLRQIIRLRYQESKMYAITSVVAGVLLFVSFFVLTSLIKIYYLFSFVISFVIYVTVGFILNKIYVFNLFNSKSLYKQYYHFFIVSVSAFFANLLSLYILVDFFGVWYLLAQFIISLIGLPLFYFINRRFVFSHR